MMMCTESDHLIHQPHDDYIIPCTFSIPADSLKYLTDTVAPYSEAAIQLMATQTPKTQIASLITSKKCQTWQIY